MSDMDACDPESRAAAILAVGELRLVHRPCVLCGTDAASELVRVHAPVRRSSSMIRHTFLNDPWHLTRRDV